MAHVTQVAKKCLKESFIDLSLSSGVLKFGNFLLKSGRESPYFFNVGLFYQGSALKQIGQFYAHTLLAHKINCQQLFGPAYKGLPLATATAIALAEQGIATTVTFNRKEVKDHGEGGELIGAPLQGETVMIDDVITAGTAFREAQTFIKNQGGQLTTVLIAFDRCEKGHSSQSTLTEIKSQGIQVLSLITFHDLVAYLKKHFLNKELKELQTYREKYGVD